MFVNHEITSNRYVTEQITGQLGINLNKGFVRTWTSPVVGNIFDNCFWRLSFEGDPNEDEAAMRVEIRHDAIIPTPLFNVLYDINRSVSVYDAWRTRAVISVAFISPDIDVNPDNQVFDFVAARWNIYNPA